MCVRGWSAANAVSVMHSPPYISAVPAAVGETTGTRVPSPTVAPAAGHRRTTPRSARARTHRRLGRGGSVSFGLDRVERVALHERACSAANTSGRLTWSSDDEAPADRATRAGLAACSGSRPEAPQARRGDRRRRRASRPSARRRRALGDFAATSAQTSPCSARASPPAAASCARVRSFFSAPQLRVGGLRRRAERLAVAAAVPAPGLDAAHRHLQLACRRRTSTDTSNVRFCCAPSTSSPS